VAPGCSSRHEKSAFKARLSNMTSHRGGASGEAAPPIEFSGVR
jgi:hypothetical protein